MNPTSSPELPKPYKTFGKRANTVIQNLMFAEQNEKRFLVNLNHISEGTHYGGMLFSVQRIIIDHVSATLIPTGTRSGGNESCMSSVAFPTVWDLENLGNTLNA